MYLLAVDIGNTNISLGLFEGDSLKETFRIISEDSDFKTKLKELFLDIDVKGCIISSVAEKLTEPFKKACEEVLNVTPIILSDKTGLNMKINTPYPESVGADRLANAFEAKKYSLPAIVIDAGTAITFDIVSKEGDFIGGIIMPGINTQLKSLNTNTSKLPEIKAKEPEKAIGNTTESCILSGVIRGAASAIDGLLTQCEHELKEKATIILTGGHSFLIEKYMTRKPNYVESDFTLKGLKDIYYSLS